MTHAIACGYLGLVLLLCLLDWKRMELLVQPGVFKELTFESSFAMALRQPRKKRPRSRPRPDPETNPPLLPFDSNGD